VVRNWFLQATLRALPWMLRWNSSFKKETAVKTILVDHHFMRDLKYKERIAEVYEYAAEKKVKVMSAAEYIGREVEMLEARRRELYK
jgi:predicted metallo-beta-lactamase superfamily hydrolase